eukprot:Platyproteum_vivax@DN10811_c1_g1_i1.p2
MNAYHVYSLVLLLVLHAASEVHEEHPMPQEDRLPHVNRAYDPATGAATGDRGAPAGPSFISDGSPLAAVPEEQFEPRRIHQMTEEDIEEFRRDIREFDLNHDGELDAEELRQAFFGEGVGQNQLVKFFDDVDLDDSGTVTMAEYIEYASALDS